MTGWGGEAPVEFGVKLEERCPACGLMVYSCFTNPQKLIDNDRWDGSDFFVVWPLPRFIFVSQSVVNTLDQNGVTPLRLTPPAELTCEGKLTPGRLSYWMPPERAHALGDALGIA